MITDKSTPWGAIVGLLISWIVATAIALVWLLLAFVHWATARPPTAGELHQTYALVLFVSYALGSLVGAVAIIRAQSFSRRLYLVVAATALVSAIATGYAATEEAKNFVQFLWPAPVPGLVAGGVICLARVGRDRWAFEGKRLLAYAQNITTSRGAGMFLGRPKVAWASAAMFVVAYLTIQISNKAKAEAMLLAAHASRVDPETVALTAGLLSVVLAVLAFPNVLAIIVAIMSSVLVVVVAIGL